MRIFAWTAAASGALVVLFLAATTVVAAINHRSLERLSRHLDTADVPRPEGGSTPQDALAKFADAIAAVDAAAATELAVPALRDHVRSFVTGLQADERARVVADVRAASGVATPEEGAASVTITEPVYVELIRFPEGSWVVASL